MLQPITQPTAIWEDIAMDFITNLPAYHDHSVIMVVIDRFFKSSHFWTLPNNFSACQAAELFTTMICKRYGFRKSIISDRDSIFLSKFWKLYFNYVELNYR